MRARTRYRVRPCRRPGLKPTWHSACRRIALGADPLADWASVCRVTIDSVQAVETAPRSPRRRPAQRFSRPVARASDRRRRWRRAALGVSAVIGERRAVLGARSSRGAMAPTSGRARGARGIWRPSNTSTVNDRRRLGNRPPTVPSASRGSWFGKSPAGGPRRRCRARRRRCPVASGEHGPGCAS